MPGGNHIHIIDRAVIGKDKCIVVADIYGGKYIIGVSAGQITLLKDLGEIILDSKTENKTADFVTIFGETVKNQLGRIKNHPSDKGGKDETKNS
jgi:flagellar biogenesis protein FliO